MINLSPDTNRLIAGATRGAFSLHELLVVIAIVATLLILILGGLSGARNQSQKAQCTANLRVLGVSFSQYAGDRNGVYPPSDELDKGRQVPWGELLIRDGYLDDHRVLFCPGVAPSVKIITRLADPLPEQSNLPFGVLTYGMRTRLGKFQDSGASDKSPYRLSRIESLSRFIVLSDSRRTTQGGTGGCFRYDWGTRGWSGIDFRHSGQANALFGDGHVALVTRNTVVQLLREEGTHNLRPAYWNGSGFSVLP